MVLHLAKKKETNIIKLYMKHIVNAILLISLFTLVNSCSTLKIGKQKEQKVLMQTSQGEIILKLYKETPLHSANFIKLVKSGFYNGVLFHRVIDKFMIQGGDPDSKTAKPDEMLGNGDVGYSIPAEIRTPKIYHKYGALAAAREGDQVNPEKSSSGAQFYIVTGKKFTPEELKLMQDNKIYKYGNANDSTYKFSPQSISDYETIGGTPHLDGNYTVFGEVIEGMDIVDKISKVKTNKMDRPIADVKIIKMKLIR